MMHRRRFFAAGAALVALPSPSALTQFLDRYDYPSSAVIRGEDVLLRVDPAKEADVVAHLQRGDAVIVTGQAVAADGWKFVPVQTTSGDKGWVRDLLIDPDSVMALNGPIPTVAPKPAGMSGENPIPFGEVLKTPLWRIRVRKAVLLPDLRTLRDPGFLAVELKVVNITAEERGFGLPDAEFRVLAGDDRELPYSLFGTIAVQTGKDEWTGNYAAGTTHTTTLTFHVMETDPELHLPAPSDLVLEYVQEEGTPGTYFLHLGI